MLEHLPKPQALLQGCCAGTSLSAQDALLPTPHQATLRYHTVLSSSTDWETLLINSVLIPSLAFKSEVV